MDSALCRFGLTSTILGALLVSGCPGPDPADASMDAATETCTLASECDDGFFCNGTETCDAGACVPGTPPACDDGVTCTDDTCSDAARACLHLPPDLDGDGYGALGCADGTDCDDDDADVFAGNVELCDAAGRDEDCDPTTRGGIDDDGDGFESSACCNGSDCGPDCDDARFTSNPDGADVCNALDDDCDGTIDEMVRVSGFIDADRDGFGDSSMPRTACETEVGFSVTGGDCDDTPGTGITRSPGQPEFCDGLDNDCDPQIDEMAAPLDWFADEDGDGFGSRSSGPAVSSCSPVADHVLNDRDCDDRSSSFSPRAPEVCNGLDDDCNGLSDFQIAPGDFEDDDGDRVVDLACAPLGRDCDDRSPSVGSGDPEICDGRDNDCDTRVDEGAASAVFFRDADGDGYGTDRGGAVVGCTPPVGYVSRGGDCDDADRDRSPIATEVCDGSDADCDGTIDESVVCPLDGTCSVGACRDPLCPMGTDDCDGLSDNGCETNTATSPTSCGGCDRACGAMGTTSAPTCSAGRCVLVCGPGRDDCDGDAANGCETDLSSAPLNCGACGRRCNVGTGDTFTCTAGACGVGACRTGFSNCDGNAANGCETTGMTCPTCGLLSADCDGNGTCEDLTTRDDHCGACGVRCRVGSSCGGGVCDRPVEIDTNNVASCARFESGRVACWGDNSNGALGQVNTPPFPGGALEVYLEGHRALEVSMADTSACALVEDGTVWCWGDNSRGQLGTGNTLPLMDFDPIPVPLPPPSIIHVTLGRNVGCAMHADHTVSCWGRNDFFVLETKVPTTNIYAPVPVQFYPEPLIDPAFLAAGEEGVCIATVSGEASCVGRLPNQFNLANGNGSLVTGLSSSSPVVDLTVGGNIACLRYADRTLRCWGRNDAGVLGRGTDTGYFGSGAPATVLGASVDAAVNQWTLCSIDALGALRCVGDNQYRMNGDPGSPGTTSLLTPVVVSGLPPGTILSRSGNTSHMCAIDPAGRVSCWGLNTVAQCGLPISGPVLSPTFVRGL